MKPVQANFVGSGPEEYCLRLYVAGSSSRSLRAIQNITRICESELKGRCNLEVIDIYQWPGRAVADQVVVAPTLIRLSPLPVRKLLGDLSQTGKVLSGLGLDFPG